MTWIEPLAMETWFANVLTGSPDIFTALSIIVIMGMAGYFRMNGVTSFLMIGLFFSMFAGFVSFEIYFILLSIASMLIGFAISKVVK
jgi:hypothetical protein